MKTLSVRQPWAWLITHGFKNIENRTWPLPKNFETPQRVYLHAGLKEDRDAYAGDGACRILDKYITGRISSDANWGWDIGVPPALGAIVGEVTIWGWTIVSRSSEGVLREPASSWLTGPYGWLLEDAVAYETPVKCKGHQGFWTPPEMEAGG